MKEWEAMGTSEFIQFISLNLSEIERIEWLNEKQGAMNSLQLMKLMRVKNKPRREMPCELKVKQATTEGERGHSHSNSTRISFSELTEMKGDWMEERASDHRG